MTDILNLSNGLQGIARARCAQDHNKKRTDCFCFNQAKDVFSVSTSSNR